MRSVCQGDIFRYINEELRVTQKAMCSIFNKVREGNMTETRISEIKQGKRKGYRGLKTAASLCFTECFKQQDAAYTLRNLRQYLKREELSFPGSENEDEDLESYALRFLEYGLDNCLCPQELEQEAPSSSVSSKAIEEMPLSVERDSSISLSDFAAQEYCEHPKAVFSEISLSPKGNTASVSKAHSWEEKEDLSPTEPRGADFTKDNPLGKKILDNRNCFFFTLGVISLVFFLLYLKHWNTLDLFLYCLSLPTPVFFILNFFIATSPLYFGLIDTALAVFFYSKRNPKQEIKLKDIPYIAKYGDVHRVIPGMGRYDLSPRLICYSLGCNVLGAFSSMAFYIFLRSIPDFSNYVGNGDFVPMANISLAFNMFVTFVHSFFLFTREPMEHFNVSEENPDTKKMDRLHVIANSFHMIFNMTFSSIGILLALVYGYMHGGEETLQLSPAFAIALVWVHAYLWFSSCSPFAVEFNAECAGSFIIIFPIVFVLSTLYAIIGFRAGVGTLMVHVVNFAVLLLWLLSFLKDRVRSIFPLMRMHRAYFLLYALLIFLFFLLAAHI
jgi:hypothetical protein